MLRISLIFYILSFFVFPAFCQKIFMTGDSHVSISIYPQKVGEVLVEENPNIDFSFWGKGGAGFYTFNDNQEFMDILYDACPDILIVHLGTNDSYARQFNEERLTKNVTTFYNNFHSRLPECKIIFVTPFYNKNKEKGTGNWQVNKNTRLCADALLAFSRKHPGVTVIDNNADYGMMFLEEEGLIRSDYVHLTVEGYHELGQQVADAIISLGLWDLEEPPYFESY